MESIPTNLVTGFLGVGKTTAVIDLLKQKAPGSRWAVLVNEYGTVSIDGALIDGASPDCVTVREVGGGCVCCAAAPFLPVAIHFLLLEANPERLIIETTGLGHPARLLDSLRTNYHGRLDVRATIGLVDPADFAKPEMKENPIFVDQIQMADVLVMNKLDTATPEVVLEFQKWANGLFPPKLLIAGTTKGHIDPAWLDLGGNDERRPIFAVEPGEYPARGWVFDPTDVFDEGKLVDLLAGAEGVTRLKGVFRVADEWIAVNRVGAAVSVSPTAYRRDSRLEVFAETPDWDSFERRLRECLLSTSPLA
jgi:G3E family GTPase